MVKYMKSFYDVQQLLKRYGTFIYTGDRLGDVQLMDLEIDELYKSKLITNEEFTKGKLVLRKEMATLKNTSS